MVLYLLFFCLCLKVPLVYPPVCFWVSLKVPFSNIFLCLPIKKKGANVQPEFSSVNDILVCLSNK